MRSIYSSILLSSLLFTGVATTATRTVESGSWNQLSSDIASEMLAEKESDFCTRGSDRETCLNPQSQLLLASSESKPEVDESRDQMPRGTGRREILSSGRGSGRVSLKDDDGRGSGRRELTNLSQYSDDFESQLQAHRASGRVEG
jgi:hypothetical protein